MEKAQQPYPPVALLTDFGERDGYVGIMKGVILDILHQAQFVDITHVVAPHDIAAGAWILATGYRYFPAGTIFLCVVDPGVGSERRPLAVHAGNWLFVAPDNGLLSYVFTEQPVHKIVLLDNSSYHRPLVSTTFQGRDIFAPVAAHLARGVPIQSLGTTLKKDALICLPGKAAHRQEKCVYARIVHIDHFGNSITNIPASLVPDFFTSPTVCLSFATGVTVTERRHFFADQAATEHEGPFLYIDSAAYVGIAIQNRSVATLLKLQVGDAVTLVMDDK